MYNAASDTEDGKCELSPGGGTGSHVACIAEIRAICQVIDGVRFEKISS